MFVYSCFSLFKAMLRKASLQKQKMEVITCVIELNVALSVLQNITLSFYY